MGPSWQPPTESANRGHHYIEAAPRVKRLLALSCRECQPNPRVRQFCAPPKPFMASVMLGGFSMIGENRTTVTVSYMDTGRP